MFLAVDSKNIVPRCGQHRFYVAYWTYIHTDTVIMHADPGILVAPTYPNPPTLTGVQLGVV